MLSVFSFYFTFLSPADPLINERGDMVDLTLIFCPTLMIISQIEAYLPWNYFSLMKQLPKLVAV